MAEHAGLESPARGHAYRASPQSPRRPAAGEAASLPTYELCHAYLPARGCVKAGDSSALIRDYYFGGLSSDTRRLTI